jgi:hypothetical protein
MKDESWVGTRGLRLDWVSIYPPCSDRQLRPIETGALQGSASQFVSLLYALHNGCTIYLD